MKPSDIPTHKSATGFEIESDEGWGGEYATETDSTGDTGEDREGARQAPQEHDQPVYEPDDREREEGIETPRERALQLLSAIETACRDLQKYEFAEEKPTTDASQATVLHRFIWLCAMEICGRDTWDLTRWEQTPDPNCTKDVEGRAVLGLADLVLQRD